jgi:hypothetical protein
MFCCLRLETTPTWRTRSPYLYPPRTGYPSYTPRYWFPFSSPPTTRRATVEVFDPASTILYTNSTRSRSNRPVNGRHAEWTQSRLHPLLCKKLKKKTQVKVKVCFWRSHQYLVCIPLRSDMCYMPCPSHAP